MRERELLAAIRAIFDRPMGADVVVGNGDDGAVIDPQGERVVIASDVAVEDIHFRREWSSPEEIGRKIATANIADIYAMGGRAKYLLVSAVIPRDYLTEALELAKGIAAECDRVGASVVGGDLSSGDSLVISISAVGYCGDPLRRSGARIGDAIMISHMPGRSAAGLFLLQQGITRDDEIANRARAFHKAPRIDFTSMTKVFPYAHAAIDISDGLLIDSGHMAEASQVAIDLDTSTLHDDELEILAKSLGVNPLDWILRSGEEHALLIATDRPELCEGFIQIGCVSSGNGIRLDGRGIEEEGFQHSWNEG